MDGWGVGGLMGELGRTKRNIQRNLDRKHRKEVIPFATEGENERPMVVVVAGPKNVGKSTLIRSIVKAKGGERLRETKGPITVNLGRKRITLIECPADSVESAIDCAKIADIVITMVN